MKVLLIGGTGHIGGRLAERLVLSGAAVTATTRDTSKGVQNSVGRIIVDDVLKTDWEEICAGFTHVVSLVSPRERDCNANPELAKRVVEEGTKRIVEAAHKVNLRFVYLSTSQVYGSQLYGQVTESSPTSPVNTYAAVHLTAEEIVRDVTRDQACVVRLANSVGLPLDRSVDTWHLLAHDIAREVIRTGRLTLRTAGLQHRSFIAMSEVTDALAHILFTPDVQGIVNISNPVSTSVRSMAELINRVYESLSGEVGVIDAPDPTEEEAENPFELMPKVLAGRGLTLGRQEKIDEEIREIFRAVKASA